LSATNRCSRASLVNHTHSRRRRASRRCGNARWFDRSFAGMLWRVPGQVKLGFPARQSLQLRVLRLGFLQDGNVRRQPALKRECLRGTVFRRHRFPGFLRRASPEATHRRPARSSTRTYHLDGEALSGRLSVRISDRGSLSGVSHLG